MTMPAFGHHGSRSVRHLALLAATAFVVAACSGSAERFADYPDVNTSSLPKEQAAADEDSRVAKSPLPDSRPAWQNAADVARTGKSGTVVVQPGQTLYSIATANGLSPSELAAANDIAPPYAIRVGQTLKIPGRANPVSPNPTFGPQTIEAANAPAERSEFGQSGTHVVRSGETLFAIGRTYQVDPFTIAEYNRLPKPYALKAGQTLRIPPSSNGQRAAQQPATLDAQLAAKRETPETAQLDKRPEQTAGEQPAIAHDEPVPESGFRWPVQGRVISTFGQKPSGMRNEGINIAVPEGTSVRAAESGVVAYAGNELKGYGNLILIRHDGGWVTAYAHNKELLVNRGDTVKRGDVIAKAGQTGSVTSPQVHFELRKGATAVDPMKYLGSAQAMN